MNLVIMPVYQLSGWPEPYPWFVKMAELCAASFRLNMADVDDVVILQKSGVSSFVEMFRDVFAQTRELWNQGHSLFFTDADALCVRSISAFGVYPEFRLFSKAEDNRFPETFPIYMLSGSRYLPQTMDEQLWRIGLEVWARESQERGRVFGSHWDYEQYVYNHMFFAQPGMKNGGWKERISDEFNLFYEWEDQHPNAAILSYNTSATWRGGSKMTMEERLQLMENRMPNLRRTDVQSA